MPYFCRSLISQAMNHGAQRSLSGSKVLVLGVAYKADVLRHAGVARAEADRAAAQRRGADVAYHDPHVPELPKHGLSSQPLDPGEYDCVTIVTAHSSIDYERLVEDAKLSSTSATRPAGTAAWTERSGSCDQARASRSRRMGQEPRAQLRRPSPTSPGSATPTSRGVRSSPPAIRTRESRETSKSSSPTRSSRQSWWRRRCRRITS